MGVILYCVSQTFPIDISCSLEVSEEHSVSLDNILETLKANLEQFSEKLWLVLSDHTPRPPTTEPRLLVRSDENGDFFITHTDKFHTQFLHSLDLNRRPLDDQ